MTPKEALDLIVVGLSGIDARLSGDDSPLGNPWEEIKDQLQNELSPLWPAYLETINQFVSGLVRELGDAEISELNVALKCSPRIADKRRAVEQKLLRRVLSRGKKEAVSFDPFNFEYFCYRLSDFTVYGRVIRRTGSRQCYIKAFSVAVPTGEYGLLEVSQIESILTRQDFDAAQGRGWSVANR